MYKTMCTYCELPPSFPTLPVQQTHEVIVVKKKILESAALEELEKGRELTVLFCTFDKMSFNLQWARKTQIDLAQQMTLCQEIICHAEITRTDT